MHTAICAFHERHAAEQARDELVRAGFERHDIHIEHKELYGEHHDANDAWDGMEREIAVDRGVLSSFGHFFASLFGRDTGRADTYSRHVEHGSYVVVVDAHDVSEAERARSMLTAMQGSELNVVQRPEQRPLRDIVGTRQQEAGMVERSREPYEGVAATSSNMESEHALASHRMSPTSSPDLRDPDLERAPGLRYSDKDKPNG